MKDISHDAERVAGGFGAYDVGVGIGQAARAALDTFIEMGKLYTPVL